MLLLKNDGDIMELIITSGQHRNEKSAITLAPLVADSLRNLGYDVLLLYNPEERTLLEIVRDAYDSGRKIRKAEVEKLLNDWEKRQVPELYPGIPIFNLHNDGLNPNDFVPDHVQKLLLDALNIYDAMNLGRFKRSRLAYKLKYFPSSNGALIEIPDITETGRNADEMNMLRTVLHHRTFAHYVTYFLSTDMERTRQEGLMSDKVVQILTNGIDHIATTGLKS